MALRKEYGHHFERVSKSYPIKVGKFEASKEFDKLTKGMSDADVGEFTEELVMHIERRKKEDVKWLPNREGNTFIPHLCRFLKHRRFEDEYQKARRHPSSYIKPEPDEPRYTADPEVALRALEAAKRAVRH
jgi:hypothetical protein